MDIGLWILQSFFIFANLFFILLYIHSELYKFVWIAKMNLWGRFYFNKWKNQKDRRIRINKAKIEALERTILEKPEFRRIR